MKKTGKLAQIQNSAIKIVLIFLISTFLLSFVRNIGRVGNINKQIREKEKRIEIMRSENEEIKRKIAESNSKVYKERQYRDSLGLAKEGEIVVVLPEKSIIVSLAPTLPQEVEEELKSNWRLWLEAFDIKI